MPSRRALLSLVALPVLLGAAGGATSAFSAAVKPKVPKGAQAVAKAAVTQQIDGKYRCLRTTAGMVLAVRPKARGKIYFVSYGALQRNAVAAAKTAKGRKKAQLTNQARRYKVLREQGNAACIRVAAGGSSPGGSSSPGATAVEVNFARAVGVAVGGTAASASERRAGQSAMQNQDATLNAVLDDGGLRSAVTRGKLVGQLRSTHIGPDGAVYLVGYLRPEGGYDQCTIYRAPRAGGLLSCISTDAMVYMPGYGPSIQFDAAGAAYFHRYSVDHVDVIRWLGGASTTVATAGHINQWLVQPNGDIFIAGMSPASTQTWTRRFPASGGVQSLANTSAQFILRYGDGNVYFGTDGVRRFIVASSTLDPTGWLGCSGNGGSWTHDAGSIVGASCGSSSSGAASTASGKTYAWGVNGQVYRSYPTPASLNTIISRTATAATHGEDLIIAGTSSGGQQFMTRVDTDTGNETVLLGGANEIEVYRVRRAPGARAVMFDGLRFADNKYVIGRVNLNTNVVTVKAAGSSKLADFETFPG